MYAMRYLTGDGWQWVRYNGMMPVGETEAELMQTLETFGWTFKGRIARSAGQGFQFTIVNLTKLMTR